MRDFGPCTFNGTNQVLVLSKLNKFDPTVIIQYIMEFTDVEGVYLTWQVTRIINVILVSCHIRYTSSMRTNCL